MFAHLAGRRVKGRAAFLGLFATMNLDTGRHARLNRVFSIFFLTRRENPYSGYAAWRGGGRVPDRCQESARGGRWALDTAGLARPSP